jgi:O-antigen/teichoic acid export membrane protein
MPAQTALTRQVRFKRLAILRVVSAAITTLLALFLAWNNAGIWSLLSVDLANALILVTGLYVLNPVWHPELAWSPPVVRYFLRFGSTISLASILVQILDRLDDVWTGHFLGDEALGFYSRAYAFANYPRRMLANPITAVAFATYAEVRNDRSRLSKAFFRVNALIVRMVFPFSSILFLVSPEFITLILGERWLPMLGAFRLMIAYTLIDPIKHSVGHLFVSVGCPGVLTRTRLIQLLVLVAGLVVLSPALGIEGVALTVTAMSLVGVGTLLRRARQYVDFSLTRLFAVPMGASLVGALLAIGATHFSATGGARWLTAGLKTVFFALAYGSAILIMERPAVHDLLRFLRRFVLQAN